MVHKTLPKKMQKDVRALSHMQLYNLLVFIMAMISKKKGFTKAQKKRLASKVKLEKTELRGRRKSRKGKKSGGKTRKGKKRRRSAKQVKNAQRFKAFVKRHGRGPHKGEKLSD
jgi:hypothetical protein